MTGRRPAAESGCGAAQLIDQKQGAGWSPFNPDGADPPPDITGPPTAVIQLPQAVTIKAFGLDPSHTCGDGPDAATKDYRIETSPDGVHFAVAKQGTFGTSAIGKLTVVAPTANATNVRFIRLTLLSPQDDDATPGVDRVNVAAFVTRSVRAQSAARAAADDERGLRRF